MTDQPASAPAGAAGGRSGAGRGGRRGKGYFLPGAIALVALLAIGLSVGAGDLAHPAPHTLAGPDVASEISLGVQAQQNAAVAPRVTCPNEPVRQGLRFTCTLVPAGGGASRTVEATEVDARGRVSWTLTAPSPR